MELFMVVYDFDDEGRELSWRDAVEYASEDNSETAGNWWWVALHLFEWASSQVRILRFIGMTCLWPVTYKYFHCRVIVVTHSSFNFLADRKKASSPACEYYLRLTKWHEANDASMRGKEVLRCDLSQCVWWWEAVASSGKYYYWSLFCACSNLWGTVHYITAFLSF